SGGAGLAMASTRVALREILVTIVLLLLLLLTRGLSKVLSILLVFVDGPVKDIVVLESLTDKQITEDLANIGIVRRVVEAERTSVVEVDGKLVGEAPAENLGGSGHLLLHDTVVLLLLGGSLQALPWKGATAEVEHDIAEGLHIVSARLLYSIVNTAARLN